MSVTKPGFRSRRLRSGQQKSSEKDSPGIIGSLARAWRLGSESNDALTALTKAYEAGDTLDQILAKAASETGTEVDDKAAETIRDYIGQVRNTLFNLHAITLGLADTFATLHDGFCDLEEKSLIEVVEGDKST